MRHIFEIIPHTKDAVGIQTIYCKKGLRQGKDLENSQVVVLAWCSPYASKKRNHQLEKALRKVYTKYYIGTLIDNYGLFWINENEIKE